MATHTAPILERILEFRRVAIEELKVRQTEAALATAIASAPAPRDFAAAITGKQMALIAECKERSPSAGLLRVPYDPITLAQRYEANGAAAISVLTEPEFFGGSLLHLKAVRERVGVPVLCKDFIIDPIQVKAARAAGADCVLLITAILDDDRLSALTEVTKDLGMQALVEVHDEADMARAVAIEAAIIGINNRDLTTMSTDRATTARLRPLVARDRVVVSESGISTGDDLRELHELGINAVLVGEALLRSADLDARVRELSGR